jgi:hypothetical protein
MPARRTLFEKLACQPTSIRYDVATRTATIILVRGHCPDMTGTIGLVCGIDPDARRIEVWSGEDRDIDYIRSGGDWHGIDRRGK